MSEHVVPRDSSGHALAGVDCWCCPVFQDAAGSALDYDQALELMACDLPVIVIHRSEVKGVNTITGDIPWQS